MSIENKSKIAEVNIVSIIYLFMKLHSKFKFIYTAYVLYMYWNGRRDRSVW